MGSIPSGMHSVREARHAGCLPFPGPRRPRRGRRGPGPTDRPPPGGRSKRPPLAADLALLLGLVYTPNKSRFWSFYESAKIAYAIYRLFFVGLIPDNNPEQSQAEAQHTAASDRAEPRAAVPLPPPPPPSFLEQLIPESPVVPESAPLYREQIEVKSVPHLSGCITYLGPDRVETCNCYTQQGTRLDLSYAECHAYLDRPPFQYWQEPRNSSPAKPSSDESLADSSK